MDRDVAPAWIVANFVTMAVAGILTLAAFLLRGALGATAPDASFIAKAIFVAFEIVIALAYMALYARMTGAVLRRIVPDLPQGRWLRVHLAVGVVAGVSLGFLMLEPDSDEQIDWASAEFAFLAVIVLVLALLLGAAFGGVQAAVLRSAANGMRFWIGMSAIAMGAIAVSSVASLPLMPPRPTLGSEAVNATIFTVVGIVVAVIMLPALRRLRPRSR